MGTSQRRIAAHSRTCCSTERELCSLRSLPFASFAGQELPHHSLFGPASGRRKMPFLLPSSQTHTSTLSPSPLPPGAETSPFPCPTPRAHQPLPQGLVPSMSRTRSLCVIEPDHTACVSSGAVLGVGEKHSVHGLLVAQSTQA